MSNKHSRVSEDPLHLPLSPLHRNANIASHYISNYVKTDVGVKQSFWLEKEVGKLKES